MHGKQTSKQKRRACAVPVLGAAGLSLSLATGASAITAGPAADIRRKSLSVRRKSLTSAWRRFMSSTRRTQGHRRPYNLPEAATGATAGAVGAEAATEAAEAAEAVGVAVASAAEVASGFGGFRLARPHEQRAPTEADAHGSRGQEYLVALGQGFQRVCGAAGPDPPGLTTAASEVDPTTIAKMATASVNLPRALLSCESRSA